MYLTYKDYIKDNKDIEILLKNNDIVDNNERVVYSKKYLKGKKILNVGCLNHTLSSYNKQHEEIVKLGSFVVGVDIIEEAINIGKNIEIGNITDGNFIDYLKSKYGKFDCIFAGELIEHLDNYKIFFNKVYELLEDKGTVVISTPNPFGLHYFKEVLFKGILAYGNTDHKCWIDIYQLIFNIKEKYKLIDYVNLNPKKSIEQLFIKIFRKPQLSMNYLAVFEKIGK